MMTCPKCGSKSTAMGTAPNGLLLGRCKKCLHIDRLAEFLREFESATEDSKR